jgi:predicted transcriptional regulator
MSKVKMSFAVSPEVMHELDHFVNQRERSRFIEKALLKELKRIKREKLIEAYRESAEEAKKENQFLEGVSGDGIS